MSLYSAIGLETRSVLLLHLSGHSDYFMTLRTEARSRPAVRPFITALVTAQNLHSGPLIKSISQNPTYPSATFQSIVLNLTGYDLRVLLFLNDLANWGLDRHR